MSNPGLDPDDGWGKLNQGQVYVILATDVLRALMFADIGKYDRILVMTAIERSWGTATRRGRRGEPWPDPEPFACEARQLGRELGLPYQKLQDAKTWLVKARIFREVAGGVLFEKRAQRWVDPKSGKPLLNPTELALCYAARTRSPRPDTTPDQTSMITDSTNKVYPPRGTECTHREVRAYRGTCAPPRP